MIAGLVIQDEHKAKLNFTLRIKWYGFADYFSKSVVTALAVGPGVLQAFSTCAIKQII